MTLGVTALSMEMSQNDRCVAGSYLFSSSTVNSSLQKEKDFIRETAQSITE